MLSFFHQIQQASLRSVGLPGEVRQPLLLRTRACAFEVVGLIIPGRFLFFILIDRFWLLLITLICLSIKFGELILKSLLFILKMLSASFIKFSFQVVMRIELGSMLSHSLLLQFSLFGHPFENCLLI